VLPLRPGFTVFDVAGAGPSCCTWAVNINDEGTIAGDYLDSASVSHGYLRFNDGSIETFSFPGAGGTGCGFGTFCGTGVASTDGLNRKGDVAGGYIDSANTQRGLIRHHDGSFVVFDVAGAGTGRYKGTNSSGINNRLDVSGWYIDQNNVNHGFIRFPHGWIETFDVIGAGTGSGQGTFPQNINREGDTAGNYIDSTGNSYGFLRYHDDGRIVTFNIPNSTGVFPYNNNALNAIVGTYFDAKGNPHGFLRTPPDE
jgi:hypothetical protein